MFCDLKKLFRRFLRILWIAPSVEILAKVGPRGSVDRSGATIPYVAVFKRLSGSHLHVRTPIMIGVILVLVVLMSGFCYYRGGSVRFQGSTVPGFEGSER